jgi:hypothetical protein
VISLQAQKHELIREAFRSAKRVAGFQSSTALYSVACEEGSFQPTSKAAFYSLRSLPGCPSKTQHPYLTSAAQTARVHKTALLLSHDFQ